MRWLLLKDLQILRRSPLQAVAARRLSGADRGPGRLRDLARAREAAGRLPQRSPRRTAGSASAGASCRGRRQERICERVECVRVERPRGGRRRGRVRRRAGGAGPAGGPRQRDQLALDPDPADARRSKSSSTRRTRSRRRRSTTGSTPCWPRPTWLIARRIASEGGRYLNLLIDGGDFPCSGQTIQILGLKTTAADPRSDAAGAAAGPAARLRSTG